VLAVKKPDVCEAKHRPDSDDIKQVPAKNAKSLGILLSSRPSIPAATPLALSDFILRGAKIVASPAIYWTAFRE
jgi:hypothetical protein